MKVAFLVSDDYIWSPKVLRRFLSETTEEVVALGAVHPKIAKMNGLKQILLYLNVVFPLLFAYRATQSIINRFRASFGAPTSIHNVALNSKIPYRKIWDVNARATIEWLRQFSPDVIFSIQTQYIKGELLHLAKQGIINVHPSKLPSHRGPAAIFWTLFKGESQTAITAHFTNEKFDDGKIVAQYPIEIAENESYFSLGEKITAGMPKLLLKAMESLRRGGPFEENPAFDGCYKSFPKFSQAFAFHWSQTVRIFKKPAENSEHRVPENANHG